MKGSEGVLRSGYLKQVGKSSLAARVGLELRMLACLLEDDSSNFLNGINQNIVKHNTSLVQNHDARV